MIKASLLFVAITTSFILFAQHQTISYQQAFGNEPNGITKPMASFVEWTSDDVFRIRKTGSLTMTMEVNIGKQTIRQVYGAGIHNDELRGIPLNAVNAMWSPDRMHAAYTINNNLFLFDRNTQTTNQLTSDGSDVIMNGYQPWLYYEEILGKWMNFRAFWWSPDSKSLVFMRFDETEVATSPILITKDNPASVKQQRFPIAGGKIPKVKLGCVDIATNKITWAGFNENEEQYFRSPYFTPSGEIWLQWVNRKQDQFKVFALNKTDGSLRQVYNEKEKNLAVQNDGFYFLHKGKYFIDKTDKSGWTHFNLYDMNGQYLNPITTGDYHDAAILYNSPDEKTIWFMARKESSTRMDLYRINTNGKDVQRITQGAYDYNNITVSPSGNYFVATYSNIQTPAVMAVFDKKGKLMMKIDSVKAETFTAYSHPRKQLVRIKSADGKYDLPFTITYPINFDSTKTYPVLMNVYGGPYRSEVMDRWSYSGVEQWFAQEGMIQVTADNRTSWHFGKEALKETYGKMGLLEIGDFITIGKWLKQQSWVSNDRLAMIGFSFGGYMTCLALTYGSDVFDFGVAHWPLTDWRY